MRPSAPYHRRVWRVFPLSVCIIRPMDSPFLTVPEVAAYLRVDPQTVRRWCTSGDLPAIRAGGRGVFRIRRDALDGFVKAAAQVDS